MRAPSCRLPKKAKCRTTAAPVGPLTCQTPSLVCYPVPVQLENVDDNACVTLCTSAEAVAGWPPRPQPVWVADGTGAFAVNLAEPIGAGDSNEVLYKGHCFTASPPAVAAKVGVRGRPVPAATTSLLRRLHHHPNVRVGPSYGLRLAGKAWSLTLPPPFPPLWAGAVSGGAGAGVVHAAQRRAGGVFAAG